MDCSNQNQKYHKISFQLVKCQSYSRVKINKSRLKSTINYFNVLSNFPIEKNQQRLLSVIARQISITNYKMIIHK